VNTQTIGGADPFQVELDRFQGPLDLLLHLIRKQDIDIFDIPIGRITEQFLHASTAWERAELERAGEFLEMAATLVRIKAQMLFPRRASEEEEDPRADLVRRLLEYEHFREAALHRGQDRAGAGVARSRASRGVRGAGGALGNTDACRGFAARLPGARAATPAPHAAGRPLRGSLAAPREREVRVSRRSRIVEAVLFASHAPLSAAEIARADEALDEEAVEAAIAELRGEYGREARAFDIVEIAGGYQLLTRPEYAPSWSGSTQCLTRRGCPGRRWKRSRSSHIGSRSAGRRSRRSGASVPAGC
jgi:hypothetical protein